MGFFVSHVCPNDAFVVPPLFDPAFSTLLNSVKVVCSLEARARICAGPGNESVAAFKQTRKPSSTRGIDDERKQRRLQTILTEYCAVHRDPGAPEFASRHRAPIVPDIGSDDPSPFPFDAEFDSLVQSARSYRLPKDYQLRKSSDAKLARLRARVWGRTMKDFISRSSASENRDITRPMIFNPNRTRPASPVTCPSSAPTVAGGDIGFLSPLARNFTYQTFRGIRKIKRCDKEKGTSSFKQPSMADASSRRKGKLPASTITKPTW